MRDGAMLRFQRGETLVLSNVDLFGEGVDVPAAEACIMLRPTKSLAVYLQQAGRVLRPAESKPFAVILDHSNNSKLHGLPCADRVWTLAGRQGDGKGGGSSGIRLCKQCFAALKPGTPECKFCGYVFEAKEREIQEVDGQLVEVGKAPAQVAESVAIAKAHTYEQLLAVGYARGKKNPQAWARHIVQARLVNRQRQALALAHNQMN